MHTDIHMRLVTLECGGHTPSGHPVLAENMVDGVGAGGPQERRPGGAQEKIGGSRDARHGGNRQTKRQTYRRTSESVLNIIVRSRRRRPRSENFRSA